MDDEFGADFATAGEMTVGTPISGTINSTGDKDWIAIDLDGSYIIDGQKAYTVRVVGDGSSGLSMPSLSMFLDTNSENPHEVSKSFFSGSLYDYVETENSASFTFAGYDPERAFLEVTGNGTTGDYTVYVDEYPDDFPANTSTTGLIVGDGQLTGEILGNDEDWIAWQPVPGKQYALEVLGDGDFDTKALTFPFGSLVDVNGNSVADFNDTFGTNGRATSIFATDTAATYYFVVVGTVSSAGTYTVSATEVVDDFGQNVAGAGMVTVGGSVTGELEVSGDADLFAVDLLADKNYLFDLEGVDTGKGTLSDPSIVDIYVDNGTTILPVNAGDRDTGVGRNASTVYSPSESGTYYVMGNTNLPGDFGTYTLSVTEFADDFPNNPQTTGVLSVDQPASGNIDTRTDLDWFAMSFEAGQTYVIDLEGSSTDEGTHPDPGFGNFYDGEGDRIDLFDSNKNRTNTFREAYGLDFSRLVFNPDTDGALYIEVTSDVRYNRAATGTYTLGVSTIDDDFTGSSATTGVLPINGSVRGNIDYDDTTIYGGDLDWFSLDVSPWSVYAVSLTAVTDGAPTPEILTIRDAEGRSLNYEFQSDAVWVPLRDGPNFIEVMSGDGGAIGPYELQSKVIYQPTADEVAAFETGPAPTYEKANSDYPAYPTGSAGTDIFLANRIADILLGSAGSDMLIGGIADDIIVGDDTLSSSFRLDIASTVYRSFALLLGREPDQTGLHNFATSNFYPEDIAHAILFGREFVSRVGELTDEGLVDFLYDNLRGPGGSATDAEKQAFLVQIQDYGLSRIDVATGFFNSPEWRAKMDGADSGFALSSNPVDQSDEVFSTYHAVLGRDPDAPGFDHWMSNIADGLSETDLAGKFMSSREFALKGEMTDRGFVDYILTNINGTPPNAEDVDAALAGGLDRATFVAEVVQLADDAGLGDWISAQGTDDILIGLTGDNTLFGGARADKFVFAPDDGGTQTILDFEAWDLIDLNAFGYHSVEDAMAQFSQSGDDIVFQDQDVIIRLNDTALAILTEDALLI